MEIVILQWWTVSGVSWIGYLTGNSNTRVSWIGYLNGNSNSSGGGSRIVRGGSCGASWIDCLSGNYSIYDKLMKIIINFLIKNYYLIFKIGRNWLSQNCNGE